MMWNVRGRRGAFIYIYTVLLSVLIHLLVFVGVSLDILWPKGVSARKPLPIRIVSVDQPKPDKRLPPEPDSRFLSDANRRESGAGKPGPRPKLRREEKDQVPARRGALNPEIASLPPPPSSRLLPQPEPAPPVIQKEAPERTTPEREREEKAVPEPEVKKTPPPPKPDKRESKPELPKSIEKARPAPAAEKPKSSKPRVKVAQKPKRVDRPRPVKKQPEEKEKRVEEKKPLEVASLPKPEKLIKPRPTKKNPPREPRDVLAMFRAKPDQRGTPDAPKLKLSDEDADRIARADNKKQLEAEEGEVVSLDTRSSQFSSYFAHLRRKVREAWDPTVSKYGGEVRLKFVLREDGSLRRVELQSSSGYRILDDVAIAAVSEPKFKPFPPALRAKRKYLPIIATFSYRIR